MKISKLFHWLYFTLLILPVLAIPIFAVYSHRHTIEGNQAEVYENIKVDFNQFNNFNSYDVTGYNRVNSYHLEFVNCELNEYTLLSYQLRDDEYLNHKFLINYSFFNELDGGLYTYINGAFTPLINDTSVHQVTFDLTNSLYFFTVYTRPSPSGTLFNGALYFSIFDLTQMFGSGYEPTLTRFNELYPNYYYDYTLSDIQWLENFRILTYDDSDIISQFSYSIYNSTENYLNLDNFFAFGDIHTWLVNNFFGGVPSLYFTIAWHFLTYWFVVSIFWLIFDVLMYVPNLVHRWLDRGAIQ